MELVKITSDFDHMELLDRIAREAFPPEEYIAPAELARMAENGPLEFFALKDGEAIIGFMVTMTHEEMAYLFFLAVDSDCRSKGYGGQALALFALHYPNMTHIVDLERPDIKAGNALQRLSRKKFYMRNGYRETGQCMKYLGIDFEILCLEEDFNLGKFKRLMRKLPIENFRPRYFTKPMFSGGLFSWLGMCF
ncbi:MAG: GNAT family N-acetyltransferase [Bacteroidales bacterium]|nr:GNAT family N-acetyltransferase [Bacteroidales bacterium]